LFALVFCGLFARAQDNTADAARLVEVLRVSPGQALADVGAGPEALLTIPMAKAVGDSGKVFATDLGQMLGRLRDTIKKSGVTNVEIVEGQPASTNLPPECCDGIFIRNVYHHFADPPAMNAGLWRSVEPGGPVVETRLERCQIRFPR
jgi:ubiquinone/menaquinone biosynthesis C-methylase UbiE